MKFASLCATQLASVTASSGLAATRLGSNPSANPACLMIDVCMVQLEMDGDRSLIELRGADALAKRSLRFWILYGESRRLSIFYVSIIPRDSPGVLAQAVLRSLLEKHSTAVRFGDGSLA